MMCYDFLLEEPDSSSELPVLTINKNAPVNRGVFVYHHFLLC